MSMELPKGLTKLIGGGIESLYYHRLDEHSNLYQRLRDSGIPPHPLLNPVAYGNLPLLPHEHAAVKEYFLSGRNPAQSEFQAGTNPRFVLGHAYAAYHGRAYAGFNHPALTDKQK